jgi:hypothetical protein
MATYARKGFVLNGAKSMPSITYTQSHFWPLLYLDHLLIVLLGLFPQSTANFTRAVYERRVLRPKGPKIRLLAILMHTLSQEEETAIGTRLIFSAPCDSHQLLRTLAPKVHPIKQLS